MGDFAAPDKFRVAVEVIDADGKPLPEVDRSMFTFRVGTADVPAASVLTSAEIQGQQWFIVQAPSQTASGKYDLRVTYGALAATQSQAVDYEPAARVDSILTIDRSLSMADSNKLAAAQDAARLYVDSWRAGDELGVVSFNDTVVVNMDATGWTDSPNGGSRQTASSAIDGLTPAGSTAIGDALQTSWDNLLAHGDTTHDWGIVLLSDGLSNTGQKIDDVVAKIVKAKGNKDHTPIIHAIALGPDADQTAMQNAAVATGGSYQFASAPAAGGALRVGASSVATPGDLALDLGQRYRVIATKIARQQQVFSQVGPLNDGDLDKDIVTIPIENGVSELVLSLSWNGTTLDPTLRDPQQNIVSGLVGNGHIVWRVSSPAGGSWTLRVEPRTVIVKSPKLEFPPQPEPQPTEALPPYLVHAAVRSKVLMEAYLPTAPADRISGAVMPVLVSLTDTGPIRGASVNAVITTPAGLAIPLALFDDGRHGDGAANDGIYGGVFRRTALPGSYGVTIAVSGSSPLAGAFTRQEVTSFFLLGGGDRDGDGIPDTWETAHGTDPDSADGDADPDNDGLTNRQEWLAGTDPHNPDSDNGGEADGSDPDPLDPSDDVLQPPSTVAYPGIGKVFVRYTLSPAYTRVQLLRGSGSSGPFSFVQEALPGTGMMTDSSVVNGTTYCYLAIAFDIRNRRSVGLEPSCATPKADPFPPHGFVQINNGQRVTVSPRVTLTLQASDVVAAESTVPGDPVPLPPPSSASGVTDMRIGNRGDLSDGVWEPYTTTRKWTLAQTSGIATVFVKFRDAAGNESSVVNAAIKVAPLDLSVCTTSPLGAANNFNLFSLGDLTQSATDVQGRVAAGGNVRLSSYSVGSRLTNSHGIRDDLVVDSRIAYTDGTVANGNVAFGGTAGFTRVNIPNGQSRHARPLSFANERVNLELESTAWSSLTPNGTTSVQYFGGPTAQITLTGSRPTLNVFALSGKDLSAANGLAINAPAGSTVIVNVDGEAPQMRNFGITITGINRQRVIYNFFEAHALTVSSIAVQGTVLAPYAAVSFNSGAIDGTMIGASVNGGGESHLFLFQGCMPVPRT